MGQGATKSSGQPVPGPLRWAPWRREGPSGRRRRCGCPSCRAQLEGRLANAKPPAGRGTDAGG